MGTLRKYLMNGAIVSSVLAGVSAFRQQRKGPTDWRTYLTWLAWGLTLAVAVGTVRIESDNEDPRRPSHRTTVPGPKIKNPKQKKPKKK